MRRAGSGWSGGEELVCVHSGHFIWSWVGEGVAAGGGWGSGEVEDESVGQDTYTGQGGEVVEKGYGGKDDLG